MGQASAIDTASTVLTNCFGAAAAMVDAAKQDSVEEARETFAELTARQQRCTAKLQRLGFFSSKGDSAPAPSQGVSVSGYVIGILSRIQAHDRLAQEEQERARLEATDAMPIPSNVTIEEPKAGAKPPHRKYDPIPTNLAHDPNQRRKPAAQLSPEVFDRKTRNVSTGDKKNAKPQSQRIGPAKDSLDGIYDAE